MDRTTGIWYTRLNCGAWRRHNASFNARQKTVEDKHSTVDIILSLSTYIVRSSRPKGDQPWQEWLVPSETHTHWPPESEPVEANVVA